MSFIDKKIGFLYAVMHIKNPFKTPQYFYIFRRFLAFSPHYVNVENQKSNIKGPLSIKQLKDDYFFSTAITLSSAMRSINLLYGSIPALMGVPLTVNSKTCSPAVNQCFCK